MGVEVKIIVFTLGQEEYGVEVDKVREILRMAPMTRIPRTPPFVKGVINNRGVVLPIIDLRGRFNLPQSEYTDLTRIIIVFIKDIEVGLIVDSANDVIDLDSDAIDDPPEVVGGIKAKYLQGIAKVSNQRLLVLLHLEEVLNKNEIIQLDFLEEL